MIDFATTTQAKNIVLLIIGPLAVIAMLVFYFWMLVDAIRKPIKNKALWIIIILFLQLLGAILYFFIGRKDLNDNDSNNIIQQSTNQVNPNDMTNNPVVMSQQTPVNTTPEVIRPDTPAPLDNQTPTSPTHQP